MRWVRALVGCSVWAAVMFLLRRLERQPGGDTTEASTPQASYLSVGDEAERWLASRELDR